MATAFEDSVDAAAIGIDLAAQTQGMVHGSAAALVAYVHDALRHVGVLPDPVVVQTQVQRFLGLQVDVDIFTGLQA